MKVKSVAHASASICLVAALAPLHGQTLSPAPSLTVTGSANQAQVAWSQIKGATGYTVMRHEVVIAPDGAYTPSTPWAAVASVGGGAYSDVLPKPAVIYEYRIDAIVRIGGPVSSNAVQYHAPPFTTPTGVTVTGPAAGTQANVSWAAAVGVTGYTIWRRVLNIDGSVSSAAARTSTPVTATSYADATDPGAIYEYQVQSVDATGALYPSAWVRYVAPVVLAAPVVKITGVANTATVLWPAVSGAASYRYARTQLDASGTPLGRPVERSTVATTFNDALSEPGAAYAYTVTAYSADHTAGPATTVIYRTPPFTTPVIVSVAGAGGLVAIAWCTATGVSGYEVWRRTMHPNGSITDLLERSRHPMNAASFTDVLPTPGLTYEFQVVGVGTDGRRWPSEWVRHAAGTW